MKSNLKRLIPLNSKCGCGSGNQYKRCCYPKGVMYYEKGKLELNTHLNRYESAIDHHYAAFNYSSFKYEESDAIKGRLKCRLVHMEGDSIVIPDYIFLGNGEWIQPLFFTAPYLVRLEDDYFCYFYMDIAGGETIKLKFFSSGILKTFDDKSQLFECEIYGPHNMEDYTSGEYFENGGNILLHLYHHTNDKGFDGITGSNSLWSSKWNYRGSKECVNYNFLYFTHIPEIKFASDLITVAMSMDGNIDYMIDSFAQPNVLPQNYRDIYKNSIYTAEVYRSTTIDRNCTIELDIAVDAIDVKHLYLHFQGGLYFYEVCFPYIHRIKTTAKATVALDEDYVIINKPPVVNSEYAIIGDAQLKDGLSAPFEEEDTSFIFKIEDCGKQTIHDFWFNNSNQDLYSGKKIEPLKVQEVKVNPTIK
jgi:hypothetical protein